MTKKRLKNRFKMTRKRPQTIQNKMTSKWMENDYKNIWLG